jgi:fructose/tagatose bisphosphate aldolase
MYPHIPVVMHQDHGSEPAICLRSIQSGFSSVMMDGSLEADMKKDDARMAHPHKSVHLQSPA